MSRRNVALILIVGGLLWQLCFALIPGEDNAFLAKIATAGWIAAVIGVIVYAIDFVRGRWLKRS